MLRAREASANSLIRTLLTAVESRSVVSVSCMHRCRRPFWSSLPWPLKYMSRTSSRSAPAKNFPSARSARVEVTSGSRVTSASANNPASLSMSARLTAAMSLIGPRSCCRLCSSAG